MGEDTHYIQYRLADVLFAGTEMTKINKKIESDPNDMKNTCELNQDQQLHQHSNIVGILYFVM